MDTILSRFHEPSDSELSEILKRPSSVLPSVAQGVSAIIQEVAATGDEALLAYERQFDGVQLTSLAVTPREFEQAEKLVPKELKRAILTASRNIAAFHGAQLPTAEQVTTVEGVTCWRKIVPIQKVGLYVPGGTAPLFSTVLMLAIPARVAGCPSRILCTPPDAQGNVNPAILYAAKVSGIDQVYKVGGAQAIAAMAVGTQTIGKVDKIFGPGNRYVTEAKSQVAVRYCSIDMPAGPSEVMVVADATSNPAFVAGDLLSQAEHGTDSQAMLVVHARSEAGNAIVDAVVSEIERQMETLGRHEYLLPSLSHSRAIITGDKGRVVEIINAYAPEHLILSVDEPAKFEAGVVNAGSIFLGHLTPEAAGDYASGTNHTLPTSGWAASTSGVSTDSFLKKITVQCIDAQGVRNLGPTVTAMASAEHLPAHAHAMAMRMEDVR